MGGVLWWLLTAAVSGSWLVMLALVLSLAVWAVFPAVVCGGRSGRSRDRNKVLIWLGLAVLLLLILRFGGQLLLGLAGLLAVAGGCALAYVRLKKSSKNRKPAYDYALDDEEDEEPSE